jgi:RHS repeat-associated protein
VDVRYSSQYVMKLFKRFGSHPRDRYSEVDAGSIRNSGEIYEGFETFAAENPRNQAAARFMFTLRLDGSRAAKAIRRLTTTFVVLAAVLISLSPGIARADAACIYACGPQYEACQGGGWPGLGGIAFCIGQLNACIAACPTDPPPAGPVFGGGPQCSDPVDCGSGLFVYRHDDLTLPDVIPVTIGRSYRETDTSTTAFGIGMANTYDIYVVADSGGSYTYADLILSDAGRVHYVRTSSGSSYIDAVFQAENTPGEFQASTITWGISNQGWLLTLSDGTQLAFGAKSLLNSITDRNDNTVTITRDSNQNIQSIVSPNGRWFAFTNDSSGRVTQAADNSGRTVNYSYNSNGQLATYTDANGNVTSYGYDSGGHLATITTARGNVMVSNEYDTNGRVTQQTHADGGVFAFTYTLDGSGNVTASQMTDALGNSHQFGFNSASYVTSETWAVGTAQAQTSTLSRDADNLLTSQTDELGRQTGYTYDASGNLTSVTQLQGTGQAATTSATYDAAFNQLASLTVPLGHTWTLGRDGDDNLTSVTDPLGHQVTATYNSEGQIISFTNAAGTFEFGYAGGDLATISDPLGNTTTRVTDSIGRLSSITNPLSYMTTLSHDAMNNLTSVKDAAGNTTSFAYDGDMDLASVTDALSHATSYTYDSMDRRANRTDPLGASENYAWDGNNNLTQGTDRSGNVTKYTYDALNRLTQAGFGYSGGSYQSTIGYTWDGGNRLTQVVDSLAGTIARTYDGLDNLTDEQTPQGEITYSYDTASRRSTMQAIGQSQLAYAWDNANRLTAITQGSASVGFAYDSADRRTTLTLPNGVTVSYAYDDASNIAQLSYGTGGAGSTDVGTLTYNYDAAGQVTAKGGTLATTGLPTAVSGNTFNADNAMTGFNGTALGYDANGNLISDGTNTYTWDARNHLSAISGGSAASFVYDGFGRRAQKAISGISTQFLYDGWNPVQELQGGAPSANVLTGLNIDEYFTRTDSSGTGNFLRDALGSTLGLSNSSGTITTSYTYDPFGNVTVSGSANANPYQFTGRENDGNGLYLYRARYYSPVFQRFIAQDPIGFQGGDANLYGYVGENPTNWIDPNGLWGSGPVVSGGVDAGTGVLGEGGSASAGAGVFGGGSQGINVGGFASAGGFVGGPGLPGPTYPKGTCHGAGGLFGGVSGGWFFTNATSANGLSGPFQNVNLNIGEGPIQFSIQIGWSGSTWIGSLTGGPGTGVGVSTFPTKTAAGTL